MREVRVKSGQREVALVTPEGVPVRFTIASMGDRAAAFLLDIGLCTLVFVVVAVLLSVADAGGKSSDFTSAILTVFLFLLRSFYFSFFEIRWHGATVGKRRMKLRVVDRHGGALRADAIFARNFLREVEFFLPVVVLVAPEALFTGATGLAYLACISWVIIVVLFPLFNNERLRLGDIVGGTLVVAMPETVLLSDLLDETRGSAAREDKYAFTPAELDRYGILELQTLEGLLRERGLHDRAAYQRVASTILTKIGRPTHSAGDPVAFLQAFYNSLRAHLETNLVMGERRESKRTPKNRRH